MKGRIDHYDISVDVDNGPGLQGMVDIVSDGLERLGYSPDGGYEVHVTGPPELRIGVRER